MNNSIFTIRPFKIGSIWAFTDDNLEIHNEPFCGEINAMIDAMLLRADLPASEPFTALFSSNPFPGVQMKLLWSHEECGGNWYIDALQENFSGTGMCGWLCPVLCKFFDSPPRSIYVRAEK